MKFKCYWFLKNMLQGIVHIILILCTNLFFFILFYSFFLIFHSIGRFHLCDYHNSFFFFFFCSIRLGHHDDLTRDYHKEVRKKKNIENTNDRIIYFSNFRFLLIVSHDDYSDPWKSYEIMNFLVIKFKLVNGWMVRSP